MATLPGWVTPKFAPRRPPSRVRPGQSKRTGSGPDRLSPHRMSSRWWIATNRDTPSMEERYPNPYGSCTFCHELVDLTAGEAAAPGRFRATSEPTGDMEGNPAKPSGASTSRTGLLSRSSLPGALLAQVTQLPGPPLAFPREGVRDWPHPRCLPSGGDPRGVEPVSASRERSGPPGG
jgi:hypothetical protein